ncbi:hypothetical protein EIK77_008036 [Talaromyces pinophilus]|nr:hypothetical protein EIK77_008036 [Talaromyces pinophilus]
MESKNASDLSKVSMPDASETDIVESTVIKNATTSEQTPLLAEMESKETSFVISPEPAVTENTTVSSTSKIMGSQGCLDMDAAESTVEDSTTSSAPPSVENMLSKDTSDSIVSDSNVPDSTVTEVITRPPNARGYGVPKHPENRFSRV